MASIERFMNPKISSYQIPAIKEADFEDFCLDLCQELWKDDEAQPVGKKGSTQQGVDISGQPDGGTDWYGAQCKNKELLTNKKLSVADVEGEVKKAKSFTPKLKRLIIITTSTRDTKVQEAARLISEEHRETGLFDVKVYAWEDVTKKLIDKAPNTLKKWYPHLFTNETMAEEVSGIRKAQIEVTDSPHSGGNKAVNIVGSNNIVTINAEPASNNSSVHNAQIDSARNFLDTHNPEMALEMLTKLKKDIWSDANDNAKFRITTNMAVALSQLGKLDDTARLFIEALQYNPDDEKALLNAATGFLLMEDMPEARKKVAEVIAKNPVSGRGWGLLLDTYENDKELQNIVGTLPPVLGNDFVVNNTLARLAMKENDLTKAEGYLRKAVVADKDGKQDVETKVRLAEVLLQQVLDDEMVVFGGHLNEKNKTIAEEALSLFTDTWNTIDATELKKYRTSWLINRSIAKRLLGDKDGSFADIELAIKTNPEETSGIRAKASLLFETGKQKDAIEWLENNPMVLEKDPSLTFLLAGFLRETDQQDRAIVVLKELLTRKDGETKNHDAKRLLIQIHLDKKDYVNAEEVLGLIPSDHSSEVLKLLEGAKIKRHQGLEKEAVEDLLKAKDKVDEESSRRQKLELANALFSLKQYVQAAELYKGLIEGIEDDEITERYLNSLYRAGNYTEALDIAEQLKLKSGLTKALVKLETAIYDDIGAPKKSEAVCLEYLTTNPEDIDIKIRLAIVKYRLHKEDEILEILTTIPTFEGLEFQQFTQLINLYREVGQPETALRYAYELRRSFFADPEAHLFYVNTFFSTERENEALFSPKEISNDTYVTLKGAQGAETSYLLEDRKDPEMRVGEITSSSSDLYGELLNQKVGEKITLNKTSKEPVEVKEIKSKYVHALHDSLKTYNTHFPKAQGLVGFTFDNSTPEATTASIQTMLDQISAVADSVAPIEKAYKDGQITIGAFAGLLNKNPIEVFSGLMSLPNVYVRVALGTKDEYEASINLIKSFEKPKLIVDVTALITIHGIGVADKVVEHFGKLGITQTTIDLINETISDRRGMKAKGFMSIAKEGESFVKEEISPEQVAEGLEYFENISKWIEVNCDVLTSNKPRPQTGEKRDTEEILGTSFVDTLSVAAKKDYILLTDDERLRSYAKSEYKIDGVWTQFVLMELMKAETITVEEYSDAVIKLVNSKYQHTSINKDIVYRAGEKANWNMDERSFSRVMLMLSEEYTEVRSATVVVADVVMMLWLDLSKTKVEKEEILSKLLKTFIGNRDKMNTLLFLVAVIIKNTSLDARTKAEIRDFIGRFNDKV